MEENTKLLITIPKSLKKKLKELAVQKELTMSHMVVESLKIQYKELNAIKS